MHIRREFYVAGALALSAFMGCHRGAAKPADAATAVAPPSRPKRVRTALTTEQLQQAKVNEAGVVPILEYHDVLPKERSMVRSIDHFKHDLQRLYEEGYRPVSLHDYLDNKIDLPAGMAPVVFTFDDARASQFKYLPDGSIDPNCVIGIWQAFARTHPDFPIKATFYVLPDVGFGPSDLAAKEKKMKDLRAMGCEIGNHTVNHPALSKLSDANVVKELGECVEKIEKLAPGTKVDTMALPMGISPKNKALLASGTYNGHPYSNRAVMLVGANPAPAPISKRFNPMRLPRIQACEDPSGSTFWLDRIKNGGMGRYISDGDPGTTTVPSSLEKKCDKTHLNGATLRVY
jgi:peptidoglycan/xylan/chitin deacetylase (PgdA/CDA1 family)